MEEAEILRQAAIINAGRRRIVLHHCANCGAEYHALKKSRYCSMLCRVQAHRKRRKQAKEPA